VSEPGDPDALELYFEDGKRRAARAAAVSRPNSPRPQDDDNAGDYGEAIAAMNNNTVGRCRLTL